MRKTILILIAVVIAIPVATLAQPGPLPGGDCDNMGLRFKFERARHQFDCQMERRGHRGPGGPGLMMLEEVGLTDEQKAQLEEMRLQFRLEMIDARAELQKAHTRLRALKHDKDASELEVNRLIDQAAALKAKIEKMQYAHHQAVKNLLTDEQKAKLEELREARPRLREMMEGDDSDMKKEIIIKRRGMRGHGI